MAIEPDFMGRSLEWMCRFLQEMTGLATEVMKISACDWIGHNEINCVVTCTYLQLKLWLVVLLWVLSACGPLEITQLSSFVCQSLLISFVSKNA